MPTQAFYDDIKWQFDYQNANRPLNEPILMGGMAAADRPAPAASSDEGSAALPGGGGMGDTLGDIYERLNRLEETVRLLLARG